MPSLAKPSAAEEDVAGHRHRDRVAGILILAVAFSAALSVSWWAKVETTPEVSRHPEPPTTAGLEGFPGHIDPAAGLASARRLSQRRHLRSIVADGVRSDGTVDVGSRGRVRYLFQSAPGDGPQPPRPPDALPKRLFCGKQAVEIGPRGIGAATDQMLVSCPSEQLEELPDPECTPKAVWQKAMARGIPANDTARIEYYRSRVGPAWRFVLGGQHPEHRFVLSDDCERLLTNEEAIAVP
ncbi:MAG: hypothetical protein JW751_23535 [Polyangiaceae bacterium]|nr:hypothetical protein [Polyangiaceae bacterium]